MVMLRWLSTAPPWGLHDKSERKSVAVSKWWVRSRKVIASTTAILVVVAVPTTLAILHEGFPVTDVDLTPRDVWVTNGEEYLAGRLNRQIEELNGAVTAVSPEFDVVQNGTDVFMVDSVSGTLQRIDPAFTRLVESVDIPQGSKVVLGGTTLAILSQSSGDLWSIDVANQLNFNPTDEPMLKLGKGAAVTVSPTGTVFATSAVDQILYTVRSGQKPIEKTLEFSSDHQLTAVGERAAILDTGSNEVIIDDGTRVPLEGDIGLKIQQAGKANDAVVVATGDALLRVGLGGGIEIAKGTIPSPVTDPGGVSSPVWLDGCAHGAWAEKSQYLLSCDDKEPAASAIPQPTIGAVVEFRVNKSVIALNNLTNGNVWLVDNDMRLVENWDEVTPPKEDEAEEGDEKSTTQSFEDTLAERTDVNRPPKANDDQMGLREGRTTILPVLENDTDPDGDVLTITKTTEIDKSIGVLDLIDGGRALQFTPAEGISNASFDYTVDDGRKGVATAHVSLKVVNASSNTAPKEKRTTTVTVEARGTTEYNVLTDWIDPDGDDLVLVSAAPVSGDQVRFTPDGLITFQSKTAELGEKEIRLSVSDGDTTSTGTFFVDVKGPGTLEPIGTPDYAEAFVGQTVVVKPLDNDVTPSGDKLELLSVDEIPAGTTVQANIERQTVSFTSPKAGTFYFFYAVGAGSKSTIGIVRVDVRENPEEPLDPIAVKDTAYLRANEPTIVKVLNNDVSPNDFVLAVQSTDISTTAEGLTVEVLNNTNIRITSSSALTEQTQFTYTISDGLRTALAGVTVVPVAPIVNRQPPVALDDGVSVRAGDIVRYPVLDNDYHPDDSQLILEPELADVSNVGEGGLAFVNGQTVRYQAPKKAGEYTVTYRVSDKFGESATADVKFTVKADDLDSNLPPLPEPQTARVFAGQSVEIDVPINGIDPDGDSVMLTRIVQPPTKGVPSEMTEKGFTYTANALSSGTDTIKYEVEDTFGAKAQGTISVGVIPEGETKDPPSAIDDAVEIKPGRSASVAVLINDSDPNNLPLSVNEELLEVDKGIIARVEDNKVILEAPEEEGTFSIRYEISNGSAGIDSAFLQVRVTEKAKAIYPTAEDYYVPFDDIVDQDSVTVDLDGLIANPSGVASELIVTVDGVNADLATVNQANQTITVRPGERRVAIAYSVTNEEDDLTGSAFIIIPPQVSASYSPPPYLRDDLGEIVVDMNGEMQWKLEDILVVPSGRPAIITEASTVVALNSDGTDAYIDKSTIGFVAAKEYRGAASISFEVTDGSDKDDINGNVATIILPFTVGDPNFTDTPPSFTTQDVRLESGPDGEQTVDLRASSSHPNPSLVGQFSYEGLSGQTNDIQASISGGDLKISSPLGSPVGAKATLRFTVKYKDFNVPGVVTVQRVPSTKPLAQAVEDTDKGRRGAVQPAYNVLANDYNPFESAGSPLIVIAAVVENGGETAAGVSFTEDGKITVSPGPVFIGTISVVYTIQDASKEKTRNVQGRYLLTVRDAPSKVDAPTATAGDLQASVAWRTPTTNGEPISGYTVTWTPAQGAGGGSVDLPPSSANHTVTGLTNGNDYKFRVVAHNIMGSSTVSDESNTVRPKGQATAPTSLSLSASGTGNGVLSMSWGGAGANGGEITGYAWTVWNGGTAAQTGQTGGATSATWAGNVGTTYTFSVVALATGGDSNPSAKSSGATPAPGKPSVSLSAPGAPGDYTLNASYGAAAANGANPTYTWSISNIGSGSGGPQSFTRTGGANTGYTLTVTATVGGVSNSASASATTPGPYVPPAPTEWSANAGSGTCPEKRSGAGLTASHYSSSGPSCSSAHGFANNAITVYCYSNYNTSSGNGPWYEFAGDGYSRAEGWLVKGDTISISGSPPPC